MNIPSLSGAGVPAPYDRNLGNITYGLYAGALLFGVLAVAAVIINYVKREEVRGTILESHFNWQIRTFWVSLLWIVVGAALWLVLVGWAVLLAVAIWYIYRIASGWLRLRDGLPV